MLEQSLIRTSLEVGFDENHPLPEDFVRCRGRVSRSVPATAELPFEDAQFEVVMMAGDAVSRNSVKEAHRVMRPSGRLFFRVPMKTKKCAGWLLPDIYSIVREGYNIIGVDRTPWWKAFGGERTITICAEKKNWRNNVNSYRPYV